MVRQWVDELQRPKGARPSRGMDCDGLIVRLIREASCFPRSSANLEYLVFDHMELWP